MSKIVSKNFILFIASAFIFTFLLFYIPAYMYSADYFIMVHNASDHEAEIINDMVQKHKFTERCMALAMYFLLAISTFVSSNGSETRMHKGENSEDAASKIRGLKRTAAPVGRPSPP